MPTAKVTTDDSPSSSAMEEMNTITTANARQTHAHTDANPTAKLRCSRPKRDRQEGDPEEVPPPRLAEPLKRQRFQVDEASEEIPPSVHGPELAQGSAQLGVPKELDHEEAQGVRLGGVVRVVHRNDIALSHLQALVQGSRLPAGPVGRRNVDKLEGGGLGHHVLDQPAGVVRRAVVDDDDL